MIKAPGSNPSFFSGLCPISGSACPDFLYDNPEAKKNNQDAIKVLRDAIDKDPASFELWNHLIRRLQRLGDKAELEKLQAGISLKGNLI